MTLQALVRGVVAASASAVVVTVSATGLRAQEGSTHLPGSLKPATSAAVRAIADSLAAEGLPAEAIYSKAREGVVKGAGDDRILSAVRSLSLRLREARSALGPRATTPELTAGASALFAGLPASELTRLAGLPRGRTLSLAYSLTVLADLASHGIPIDRVTQSIQELTRLGAVDHHLSALRRAVEEELRAGESPMESLARGTREVVRTLPRRPPP